MPTTMNGRSEPTGAAFMASRTSPRRRGGMLAHQSQESDGAPAQFARSTRARDGGRSSPEGAHTASWPLCAPREGYGKLLREFRFEQDPDRMTPVAATGHRVNGAPLPNRMRASWLGCHSSFAVIRMSATTMDAYGRACNAWCMLPTADAWEGRPGGRAKPGGATHGCPIGACDGGAGGSLRVASPAESAVSADAY